MLYKWTSSTSSCDLHHEQWLTKMVQIHCCPLIAKPFQWWQCIVKVQSPKCPTSAVSGIFRSHTHTHAHTHICTRIHACAHTNTHTESKEKEILMHSFIALLVHELTLVWHFSKQIKSRQCNDQLIPSCQFDYQHYKETLCNTKHNPILFKEPMYVS